MMNQNGDGNKNSNLTKNLKRKSETSDSHSKRFRNSANSFPQNLNYFQSRWDTPNSACTVPQNRNYSQSRRDTPNSACTVPQNRNYSQNVSDLGTTQRPMASSCTPKPLLSLEFKQNFRAICNNNQAKFGTKPYSANNRLKLLRKSLTESEQSDQNSSSNSTWSRFSSSKALPRPSSLQDRLKLIRHAPSTKDQTQSHSAVTTPASVYKSLIGQTTPFSFISNSNNDSTSPILNKTANLPNSYTSPIRNNALAHSSPLRNSTSSNDESMDWSFIDENEVLTKITEIRNDKVISRVTPFSLFQETVAKSLMDMSENNTIYKNIYIVIDTNIFLSDLNIVEQILKVKINVSGVARPILLVPWIVIQELDYIKGSKIDNNKLKRNSRAAINFLNEKLSSRHPQVQGQSVRDAAEQNFSSKNADDGILHCCLQILEKQNRPMLLSNDTNLRNKAILHGISAYSHKEILDALDPYRDGRSTTVTFDCSKVKEIEILLSHFFSFVIDKQLHSVYGNIFNVMNPDLRSPPWNLLCCVKLFKRYWQPVFSMVLQKQFLSTINEFIEFLTKHQDIEIMNMMNIKRFIDFGLAICIYLQNGLPDYLTNARECITSIESIIKTLPLPQN